MGSSVGAGLGTSSSPLAHVGVGVLGDKWLEMVDWMSERVGEFVECIVALCGVMIGSGGYRVEEVGKVGWERTVTKEGEG